MAGRDPDSFLTLVIATGSVFRVLYPYPDLDQKFPWAQELCIYMFIWMAKFGAAYGVGPASMSASTS